MSLDAGQDNGPWRFLRLRATMFPSDPMEHDRSSLWSRIFGREPDEEHRRPREGVLQQVGFFDNWTIELRVLPARVDLIAHSHVQTPDLDPELPVFPDRPFLPSLEEFKLLTSDWFSETPHVTRLAFGAVLIQLTDSAKTALSILDDYLPDVRIDNEGMHDFLYQVNRPRTSTIESGLRINRLSKWAVVTILTGGISIDLQQEHAVPVQPANQTLGVQLEVDINTAPRHDVDLPSHNLQSVFDELTDLGLEIAEGGDQA